METIPYDPPEATEPAPETIPQPPTTTPDTAQLEPRKRIPAANIPPIAPQETFFDVWNGAVEAFKAARQRARDAVAEVERVEESRVKLAAEAQLINEQVAKAHHGLNVAEEESKIAARHLHGVLSDYIGS